MDTAQLARILRDALRMPAGADMYTVAEGVVIFYHNGKWRIAYERLRYGPTSVVVGDVQNPHPGAHMITDHFAQKRREVEIYAKKALKALSGEKIVWTKVALVKH